MNIADLFINLGVKGSEKTAAALDTMKKGLKDTSSMALETKVALAGAMYALERLFAASGQRGTDLTNFNALTGVSTQTLQQYQYAARQAGVANEETAATFKSLQSAMTKTLMGEGAPKGMAHVADVLGIDITEADIEEFSRKPEKLIQILQKYAQAEKNVGLKRETLSSFGVGENVQSAMDRNVFTDKNLKAAPTYSKGEVGELDKANIAWSNLKNKIEMSIGHFNAEHGVELVTGISKITDQVIKLAEAFAGFADKIHLFEWFGKAIEGWTKLLGLFSGAVVDAGAAIEKKGVKGAVLDAAKGVGSYLKDSVMGDENEQAGVKAEADLAKKIRERAKQGIPIPAGFNAEGYREQSPVAAATPPSPVAAATAVSPVAGRAGAMKAARPLAPVLPIDRVARPQNLPAVGNKTVNGNTVNVNQTNNFNHDGKDIQKTGADLKKATQDAARQSGALGRVN